MMSTARANILAVSVGNTRTNFGVFDGTEARFVRSMANASPEAMVAELASAAAELNDDEATRGAIVIATVNRKLSEDLLSRLESKVNIDLFRIGTDVPIPMATALASDAGTGQDRLLAALAAFETAKQACVVVDAGTAVTVDFVDGVGVFQGGAIGPGARMMLRSLHEGTAQLPQVDLVQPPSGVAFGRNTSEAMLMSVFYGIRGMVRMLVERYAEEYGAYPQVIATGGDARLLFGEDEFVEHIVEDLVLRGIAIACDAALRGGEAEDDE
ncbi:MAG: type III pantothenate kinase [Planctomycetota bacterium]|nr:type III pantothenate kinase [Planctomycetota bacterium]